MNWDSKENCEIKEIRQNQYYVENFQCEQKMALTIIVNHTFIFFFVKLPKTPFVLGLIITKNLPISLTIKNEIFIP